MNAFLGTGLLGANFVRAMILKGDPVQVWNRTAAKAIALETYGAKAFDHVPDAVRNAERVHLALKDDEAVDDVLRQAKEGLRPGTVLIDHTTTSAEGASRRTREWKENGYDYLHAPVFMGPQQALESTGVMMVSGDQELIGRLKPRLSAMTGKVINLGTEVSKAASMKLIGNLFLITLTAGLADTLSLAKALHITPDDVNSLLEHWNPAALLPARIKKMTGGNFKQPTWELNMARKDAGLMLEAAKQCAASLMLLPGIAKEMDRRITQGHGHDDWTVIGKDSI